MRKKMSILAIMLVVIMGVNISGCGNGTSTEKVVASGKEQVEETTIPEGTYKLIADGINSSGGSYNLVINSTGANKCSIIADDNVIEYIQVDVNESDGTIEISSDEKVTLENANVEVELDIPVSSINVTGSYIVDYSVDNTISDVNIEMSGACKVDARGNCGNADCVISGSSDLEAEELIAKSVSVDVSGASIAVVYASEKIEAKASGTSKINYLGKPTSVSEDASGVSEIIAK